MKVKFTSPKSTNFLGWGVKTVVAYREVQGTFEALYLIGDDKTPYQPVGGRKVLKQIINTCEEGVTYYWKQL